MYYHPTHYSYTTLHHYILPLSLHRIGETEYKDSPVRWYVGHHSLPCSVPGRSGPYDHRLSTDYNSEGKNQETSFVRKPISAELPLAVTGKTGREELQTNLGGQVSN